MAGQDLGETMDTKLKNLRMKKESNITVHGRTSYGCEAVERDVMLTFGPRPLEILGGANEVVGESKEPTFLDVFVTQAQGEILYRELGAALERNNKHN